MHRFALPCLCGLALAMSGACGGAAPVDFSSTFHGGGSGSGGSSGGGSSHSGSGTAAGAQRQLFGWGLGGIQQRLRKQLGRLGELGRR